MFLGLLLSLNTLFCANPEVARAQYEEFVRFLKQNHGSIVLTEGSRGIEAEWEQVVDRECGALEFLIYDDYQERFEVQKETLGGLRKCFGYYCDILNFFQRILEVKRQEAAHVRYLTPVLLRQTIQQLYRHENLDNLCPLFLAMPRHLFSLMQENRLLENQPIGVIDLGQFFQIEYFHGELLFYFTMSDGTLLPYRSRFSRGIKSLPIPFIVSDDLNLITDGLEIITNAGIVVKRIQRESQIEYKFRYYCGTEGADAFKLQTITLHLPLTPENDFVPLLLSHETREKLSLWNEVFLPLPKTLTDWLFFERELFVLCLEEMAAPEVPTEPFQLQSPLPPAGIALEPLPMLPEKSIPEEVVTEEQINPGETITVLERLKAETEQVIEDTYMAKIRAEQEAVSRRVIEEMKKRMGPMPRHKKSREKYQCELAKAVEKIEIDKEEGIREKHCLLRSTALPSGYRKSLRYRDVLKMTNQILKAGGSSFVKVIQKGSHLRLHSPGTESLVLVRKHGANPVYHFNEVQTFGARLMKMIVEGKRE